LKDETEITGRIREHVAFELERRLGEANKRLPTRCIHNHRQPLDTRSVVEGEPNQDYNTVSRDGSRTIGLCMLGSEDAESWAGNICEDPIDAQRCPYFEAAKDKAAIMAEYEADLSNIEWVNANMPELAALLWVLDANAAPRYSAWRRFRYHFWKIQLEPVRPTVDPVSLLGDDANLRP
jgi:hypothetical protein